MDTFIELVEAYGLTDEFIDWLRSRGLTDEQIGKNLYPQFDCIECGKSTWQSEVDFYMLHDNIWASICPQVESMLCLKCAEKRLGHSLTREEIKPCFLTEVINPYTSEILLYNDAPNN